MSVSVGDTVALPGSKTVYTVLEVDSRPMSFARNPRVVLKSHSSGRVTQNLRRNRLQKVDVA